MKTNSIKVKILTVVLISIVISFSLLGFYNTKNSYNSQYVLIEKQELKLAEENSRFIDAFLESKIDIINAIADELKDEVITVDNEKVIDKFVLGKKSGKFVDVYIGFQKDGSLILSSKQVLTVEKDNYDARKRPWYMDAVKKGKAGVSKPYVDVTTKKLVVSIYTPLMQNGQLTGVIGSDVFIDTIVDTISNVKLDGMGLAYLLDEEGNIIIHKDKKVLNKKDLLYKQIANNKKLSFGEVSENGVAKLLSYGTINTTNWKLIVKLDHDEIYKEINENVIQEIGLYILLLIIILVFIFYSLLKTLAPIKTVEEGFNYFFKYLKGEESSIKNIDIKTNDEFGNMAKVINKEMQVIASHLEEDKVLIDNVKDVVSQVNQGKLDVSVEKTTSNKSLNELKDILNDMIETINHNVNKDINPILAQLKEYSQLNFVNNIPDANGNIAKGLNDLANIINEMLQENKANGMNLGESSKILLENVDILNKASNETAVSLEETAAALEEITSTVVNNTERIATMSGHSDELSHSIEEGQKLATYTVESMDSINEQTQSIADAITIIDQIAFQTNILSLNAAVEAATAGEAGKGFAVVAQEVRNLASRSAEAAKEIKELVENATDKTNSGKKIADDMINGYVKLQENITKTTNLIADISSSSKEQRTGIEQINDVVTRLDRQTQNNASVATQTHDIAINTSNIAKRILETVNEKKFRDS